MLSREQAPKGMTHRYQVSGPQTVRQFIGAPEQASALEGFGAESGFVQRFASEVSDLGRAERPEPLRASLLHSESLIFAIPSGAEDALLYLRSHQLGYLQGGRSTVKEAPDLGDGAFRLTFSSGVERVLAFAWRAENAVLVLSASSEGGRASEEALLVFAKRMKRNAAAAEPTGESLRLPAPAQAGDLIFEGRMDATEGWDLEDEGDPEGPPLSQHVAGTLQIAVDGPGFRTHDTTELGREGLSELDGTVVEVESTHLRGATARWGLMCRAKAGGSYYLFVVGADGFAGIYAGGPSNADIEELATVESTEAVATSLDGGRSIELGADCAGDPISRLALFVNDILVLDAYDDDPLAPGAVGMWVESRTSPAAVAFDDLRIYEVAE